MNAWRRRARSAMHPAASAIRLTTAVCGLSAAVMAAPPTTAPISAPAGRQATSQPTTSRGNQVPTVYAFAQTADPVEIAYRAAYAPCFQGRFADAASTLGTFAAEHADHDRSGDALFFRAYALAQLGQYNEAIDTYLALANSRPTHRYADDALIKAAEIHERQLGEYDKAISLYERCLEQYPNGALNVVAMNNAARAAVGNRAFAQADRQYQNVIGLNGEIAQQAPGNDWVEDSYYNRFAKERIEFLRAHSDHGYTPLGAYMDAVDLDVAGRPEECRERLQKIIRTWPDSAILDDCKLYLADQLRRQGDLKAAAGAYEQWLREFPKSPERHRAWFALGEYYRLTDRVAEARQAYEKALLASPGSREADLARARLGELRGENAARQRLAPRNNR